MPAVIPEFNSGEVPIQGPGVEQTMNLMQRAAQSRLLQEQLHQQIEQQRIQFEIQRPVLEAQQRAQLVGEANDLTAAHIINNSVANDLQRFPEYVKKWTETAAIEDPKERLNQRRQILGAITPFAAIKNTAPLVKAFQEQYAQDANADKTADILAGKVDVAQAGNETKLALKDRDIAVAQAKLDAQTERFRLEQAHASEKLDLQRQIAEMRNQTTQRGQDMSGQNRMAKDKEQLRNKALVDIATNRENLGQMGYAIDQMATDLKAQQSSLLGSGPVVGSDTVATIRAAAGDPTAKQVQQDIGDFANRIMSTVKNIRNIQEFRAVTAMIPRASDPVEVQNRKIQKLQEVNQTLIQRNDYREKLMRENPDLDSTEAERQAAIEFPFAPASPAAGTAAPSGLTDAEQKRLQELRAKLGK